MNPFLRWWSGSVANRVAAAAAMVIAGLVLMLAALAFGNSRALLLRNADERLGGYAELLANRMALMLSTLDADTRALAANSLVINGLLDSSEREAYLGPFLRDQRVRGGTEHMLTLVGHSGAALASNSQGRAPDYTQAPWLAKLMDGATSTAAWADPARTTLLLAYPVRLPSTNQPEGALVLEVSLVTKFLDAASVLPPDVRARLVDGARGVAQSGVGVAQSDVPLVAQRLLHGAEGAAALELAVETALPRSAALAGLYRMTWLIVLAGMLALVAAALAARWIVRRMLAPLHAMSATAQRIRAERRFDLEMPGRGGDEIGTVALGFNEVLVLVREGQARLEREVQARTAALERTRAHLDAVQRQMSDGLVVVDDSGRVETFSGAAERLFALPAAQAVGNGVARLIPQWPSLKAGAAAEIAEHGRFQRIVSARRGDLQFAAEISVALMHHEGRAQWVVLVRDDTEQQEANLRMTHNQRLLEESVRQLKQNDEDMARVNRMNELLAACDRPDEAHTVIERALAQLFAGHAGALAVQRPDGLLEVVARWGEHSLSQAQFALADCWALRLGRAHDTRLDGAPACRHCADASAVMVCLPLSVHGETLGVLMSHAVATSAEELHRVEALLGSVGEAVKFGLANLKLRDALREAALRDSLTGLFNRRYFDETAPREVQRTHRSGRPLALAAMDLDHFKRFNDGFGHEAGDLVLRETARVLAAGLRATDIVCRIGGEELAALMLDSTAEDAAARLEVVRQQLASLSLQHQGRPLPSVTLSVGVAQAPAHGSTSEDLLRAADLALYAAKAQGRDRIVVAAGVPPRAAATAA